MLVFFSSNKKEISGRTAIFKEQLIDQKLFCFYGNEEQFIDYYFHLDDYSIYDLILNSSNRTNLAYEIMNDLKNRRLFKRIRPAIDYGNIADGRTRIKIERFDPENLEEEISKVSKAPKDLVIVHKESNEVGLKSYRTFGRITEAGDTPLMYIDDKKVPHPYDDISPLITRNESSKMLYVFVHAKHLSAASHACKKILKL